MLVCPTCRNENREDASFCTTCGRSLAPEDVGLVATPRRETSELELDLPAPKRQSPLPGIITLAVILLAGIGVATWFALRPNPCAGKFSSERFPYCVVVPEGWREGQADVEGTAVDQFTPSNEGPTVFVHAAAAPEGVDTQAYTDALREGAQNAGLFPTAPRQVDVGGDDALAWDLTRASQDGSPLIERRVALVRDGMRWDILIFGKERAVQRALPAFEQMLQTWAWR